MKKNISKKYSSTYTASEHTFRYQNQLLGRSPQQLELFSTIKLPPPYPLQIAAISYRDRIKPEISCRLVHVTSGLSVPGAFTTDEASNILETTRYWDWTLDEERRPRCFELLRSLIVQICSTPLNGGSRR
ncbi:MAG: hypothetical protein ACRC11_05285 [Xenococcaceae cyanobacterium]